MRFFPLLWIAIFLPLTAFGQFSADSARYLWPTDASPYMSGGFGETRSEHFHSALDIKTWGRKGYKVYATRDGILHRIAIGPDGYGKVIYLKHPDGSYSVYAHLLVFEERIRELTDAFRFRDYSYELDRIVDSLDIEIKQGQVIGYSGATGVGPPHLHFELRTPSEKPFNPLLTNLSVPDGIPPQFSGLSVEPLSPETRIEGKNGIYLKSAIPEKRHYDFGGIEVSGPVGLGVDVFDQANRVSNVYAVYDLKLYLENELIFHSKADSFSYNKTGQMFLDRVYPVLQKTGNGYQRLHLVDGNTLPFYRERKNNGRLDLPEGSHPVRIIAEDYFGNKSEARLTLKSVKKARPPVNYSNGSNGMNGSATSPAGWEWHTGWINFNGTNSVDYTVISIDTARNSSLPMRVHSNSFLRLNTFDFVSIHYRKDHALQLYRMIPDKAGKVYGSGINAYAKFPAHTFYDTLSVALSGTVFMPDSVRLDLLPGNQPVRDEFELTYVLNEDQEADRTLAFYEYDSRRNKSTYIPTRRGGNILKGMADELGTYYILSDHVSPQLYNPRLYKRVDGRWMISVNTANDRSGIDYTNTEFYVNGIRGIAEFEPEDDRLLYYHPGFQPALVNRLRVIVTDMAGNKTVSEFVLD